MTRTGPTRIEGSRASRDRDLVSGALLVDKPGGLTSHDVVARVRRLANQRRCGHTGTLDPFATGLLVLCLGRATRLARFVAGASKSYLATVRFGFATDTYDRTGTPVGPVSDRSPDAPELAAALEGFLGVQEQRPPSFSAKRVGGERSYRLARAGVGVRPPPVRVEVQEMNVLELAPPRARLELSVSSGTYVRALAHDLGEKLGCRAHLEELRRTRVGSFGVAEASSLEELEELAAGGRLREALLSPARLLADLPAVVAGPEAVARLAHGRELSWEGLSAGGAIPSDEELVRVLDPAGALVVVARFRARGFVLHPVVVIDSPVGGKPQGP